MECVWEIIREFVELLEVLVFIFLFLNVKLTKRKRDKIAVIILAALIIVLRIVFMNGVNDERILFYEIIDFLIIWNLMNLPVKRKVIVYFFAYIFTGEINIIVIWILSQIRGVDVGEFLVNENRRILIYLIVIFIMIIIRLIHKHSKHEDRVEISTKNYIVFLIVLIPIMYYSARIFYIDINHLPDVQILYGYVKILLIAALLFANTLGILILLDERKSDKEKIIFQNELIKLQRVHYTEMKEKQQELREIRHDMKAHLMQITLLYNLGNISEFEKYLNNLQIQWDYNRQIIVDTGNYTADIILSYYFQLSGKENINFKCKGKFLDKLLINEYDLCSLLFNGISNAFEECKKLKDVEAFVQIVIKNYNKVLFIEISNTYIGETNTIGEWTSSKKDVKKHGYGVSIIKKIVEKYDGKINYSIKDEILNLEIMLINIYQ